jgi:hypothetical protein
MKDSGAYIMKKENAGKEGWEDLIYEDWLTRGRVPGEGEVADKEN